ncbi:hypothetical protein [Sphingobacterium faecium]
MYKLFEAIFHTQEAILLMVSVDEPIFTSELELTTTHTIEGREVQRYFDPISATAEFIATS